MSPVVATVEPLAAVKSKSIKSRKRRQRRRRQIAYLAICGLSVAIFGFALATIIRPATAQDDETAPGGWRKGYVGHGTTHEQMGQPHWPPVEYTVYKPTTNYTKEPPPPTSAMNSIFNFTHFLYDKVLYSDDPIPEGYIVVKNSDTLALGPKVEENDWRDLLAHYWMVLIWVFILVVLIIIIPFIAVCYCCFCCCRRCRQGCPPCTSKQDAQRRFCCGICLLILIIGLIFGIIIAFVTNKMIDSGFSETSETMKRGSEDTCTYLKDVADHVYHLMMYNYEEMETHVLDQLTHAHRHIFLDLSDTSESSSLAEMERVLENMPEALELMKQVEKMEKDLRFYGSQLRDGVRGIKRDVNFAVANLCQLQMCQKFLISSNIEHIDTSQCLHFDTLPNTTAYVEGMEDIIAKKYYIIPQRGLLRLKAVSDKVQSQLSFVLPPMMRDLTKGKTVFREQATNVRNIVEGVLANIHTKTLHSTKSFEDVYDRFGHDRNIISLIVCLLILLVLFILIFALLCGCFGRRRTGYGDECCSKSTGATCLLLAILLIFCVFSFIALVGLFYFMLGMVTYQGACAPLRDQENNTLFRQLDASIDLKHYLPSNGDSKDVSQPLKMSNTIQACHENQTIFEMMRMNNIYDINDLARIKVMTVDDTDSVKVFDEDLSGVILLTPEERGDLTTAQANSLATYHSSLYMPSLCTQFTPMNLNALSEQLYKLSNDLEYPAYGWAKVSFWNEGLNTKAFHRNFVPKLTSIVEKMRANLQKIDELISYENHDFTTTIKILTATANRSEQFIQTRGKDYINTLSSNLTQTIDQIIDDYIDMIIREANENVGHCAPLSYIYYRGVDLICHRLVDPINGFWVGILLCALLFLPILFVAHRLMCLYKKIYPYLATVGAGGVVEGGSSDYLYDAYSEREREHVPLANVPKKRRKAYERRREQQDYYEDASPSVSRGNRSGADRGGGGGGDGAPGSSNMRYNDMAPTHWDHEPPRYHNPPAAPPSSEYERPPPYYYPGASEQD
ncbi:prominin-like protein isoform X1 [Drosophila rhopaloa]|uniref:Prominin-like protein isoform X1 n=1 Tax=Drosophila rhopaloa TaxID=1041015 RepID=A0A6P4E9Z2_DRORH|nr:prominin-like protein isoform X1 [Drosophila rhopaloa]XP_016973359.1 prominin-like protein isoform X1 [Drosophila rhopaloa]